MDKIYLTSDDMKVLRRLSTATGSEVPVESIVRVAVLVGLEYLSNTLLSQSTDSQANLVPLRKKQCATKKAAVLKFICEKWGEWSDRRIGQSFKPAISRNTIGGYRRALGFAKRRGKATIN